MQPNSSAVVRLSDTAFHPLADEWRKSPDTGVNYMVLAERLTSKDSSTP